MMEVFSPSLRKLWKDLELRSLVLLSLGLQLILIILGNRRKYVHKIWIRMIVWSAYVAADSVATVALGVLSSDLGDVFEGSSSSAGFLDAKTELTAFWAPFLLLHLGGPDTITAYSLEDNDLWLRHLLGLAVQTGVTIYIVLMGWTGSRLSSLAILMTLVGLIKYGERIWVLWSASYEQRRALSLNFHKTRILDRLDFLYAQGIQSGHTYGEDTLVAEAFGFHDMTSRLFVGAPLRVQDREYSRLVMALVRSRKDWLKIIEMELGFMYDMLYTKAMVAHTPWGIGSRFVSLLLTVIVLVLFCLGYHQKKYPKVDLSITFLLLAVAIFAEVYAAIGLLFSDRTVVWLRKYKRTTTLRAFVSLSVFRNPRWSNSIGQYSLLSYFLREKAKGHLRIPKLFLSHEKLEKLQYAAHVELSFGLKKQILIYFTDVYPKMAQAYGDLDICTSRGKISLKYYGYCIDNSKGGNLATWSTTAEFEQSVLLWHIVTELCYYLDYEYFTYVRASISAQILLNARMSKRISRYIMYLVVISPDRLPPGGVLGQINLGDTCVEGRESFEYNFNLEEVNKLAPRKKRKREINFLACKQLLHLFRNGPKEVLDRTDKSLLPHACEVLYYLKNIGSTSEESNLKLMMRRWETIFGVWMELLAYAAAQCKGSQHAQQLRRGGELLTHVWLIMAHLGLTENFKL